MYKYVDFHVNWIRLNLTLPPQPEVTPTTSNRREGDTIMKIVSMDEEKKGKERSKNFNIMKNIIIPALQRYR